jgi:hypothetical protein
VEPDRQVDSIDEVVVHLAVLLPGLLHGPHFLGDEALDGDQSGFSVASAGDVNGDGFADLIVGALLADPHGNLSSGASYIVFGKASGFAANIDLSNLNGTTGFELSGEAADEQSGFSVASAGGSPSATAHRSTPPTSCSCE